MDYAKEIRTLINTGKYVIGTRKVIKEVMTSKPLAVILANNIPLLSKKRIAHYARLANVRLLEVPFTSVELGSVCGRAHSISVIAVSDFGDSQLLKPEA